MVVSAEKKGVHTRMTADEAKAAWRAQTPVMHEKIQYTIRSLVYRFPKELLVELLDKNGRCVVLTQPERVDTVDGGQTYTVATGEDWCVKGADGR